MVLVQNRYKNTCLCSEDPDNLCYALITFVLCYTPHSGDKALTQVILVISKTDSGVFIIKPLSHSCFLTVDVALNLNHEKLSCGVWP